MAVHRCGVRLKLKKHRVLIVGRGRQADIRLNHRTVSRLHLELVLGAESEIHVADRSSRNGTRIRLDGEWQALTAKSVSPADRLQLGDLETTVEDMLQRVPAEPPDTGGRPDDGPGGHPDAAPDPDLPSGPVRRNPETGEVIRG